MLIDGKEWRLVPVEPSLPMDLAGKKACAALGYVGQASTIYRTMLAAAPTPPAALDQHPDDVAVDRFAAAMKAKLAKKRLEGRGGWQDKAQCSAVLLSDLLREHVAKGDPLDVGNLAMMLHQRGESIAPTSAPALDQQAVRDAEIKRHIELVKAYGDQLYCKARAENPVDQRSWSKSAEIVLTNIVASARALKSTNGGAT